MTAAADLEQAIADSPDHLYWLATGRHACDCEAACTCADEGREGES